MNNKIATDLLFGLPQVIELCQNLQLKKLYFTGSAINGQFQLGKSDLDILVETRKDYEKDIVRLSIGLKSIYNCSIDVFHTTWQLNSELTEYFKNNKVLIYESRTACNKG